VRASARRFRSSLGGTAVGQKKTLHKAQLPGWNLFFTVRRIYARRLGCITNLHPMVDFLSKSPFESVGGLKKKISVQRKHQKR